jgi:hypothetical protein
MREAQSYPLGGRLGLVLYIGIGIPSGLSLCLLPKTSSDPRAI